MKVKIIKSSLPSYWYSDKIGQIFNVSPPSYDNYRVIGDSAISNYIDMDDCILVKNYPIGTRVFYNNGSYIAEKRKDGWYNTIGKQQRVGIDESLIGTYYAITFDKYPQEYKQENLVNMEKEVEVGTIVMDTISANIGVTYIYKEDGWYSLSGNRNSVPDKKCSHPQFFVNEIGKDKRFKIIGKSTPRDEAKLFSSEDIKKIMGNNIMSYETLEHFLK